MKFRFGLGRVVPAIVILFIILASIVGFYLIVHQSVHSTSPTTSESSSTLSIGESSIRLTDSMPLPNVGERFDHMAIDSQDQLVFVVARGNDSVYVADLITEGISHVITGLNEPQGIYYSTQFGKLYVSNGGNGTVDVFVKDYKLVKTLVLSPNAADADNMRYDSSTGLLYVGYGEENQSGIAVINTTSDTVVGSIPLNGHPEAFEIEQNGTNIYVNVPTANSIEIASKVTRTVVGVWHLPANETENFPMALDEKDQRLFVGSWISSTLLVFDTQTGIVVSNLTMPQDADDLSYDPYSQLIFASCGQGSLFIAVQLGVNSYAPLPTLPTGPLARTSLFYPEQEELFVAVPQHDGISALLLTFSVGK